MADGTDDAGTEHELIRTSSIISFVSKDLFKFYINSSINYVAHIIFIVPCYEIESAFHRITPTNDTNQSACRVHLKIGQRLAVKV